MMATFTGKSFDPGPLSANATYYWRMTLLLNSQISGQVRSSQFTTCGARSCADNFHIEARGGRLRATRTKRIR